MGGSFRDPPWVPLESTNARVLCSYGGFTPPPPISNTGDGPLPCGGSRVAAVARALDCGPTIVGSGPFRWNGHLHVPPVAHDWVIACMFSP